MTPTDTILDTIHMQLENAEEEYRLHGERALYATVPECAAYLLGLLKSDGFDVLVDAGFFPAEPTESETRDALESSRTAFLTGRKTRRAARTRTGT